MRADNDAQRGSLLLFFWQVSHFDFSHFDGETEY